MARNGSGVYTNPNPDFVSGTIISSSEVDANFSDIATALTDSIAADGQTTITANLPLSGFKLTGVGAATARTDAATLAGVQDGASHWGGTATGTADALLLTLTPAITAYATGQKFYFKASASPNTGAATVNINSVGVKAIENNGAALVADEIQANKIYVIIYDGTAFQLGKVIVPAAPNVIGTDVQAWSTVLDELSALTDPGADRLTFWDESANNFAFLTLAGGHAINGTELRIVESFLIAASDEITAITAATGKVEFRMPYAFTVTEVRASLTTAQATGTIFTVDINESGTTILSTKLTIDNTEKTSTTAVAAPVISDAVLADDAIITIDVDQIGDGTAKGLKVTLIGYQT